MSGIPSHMKAAILVELNTPLVIAKVGLPPALDVGQVLVKVHFSGVCGSQLGEIDGAKGVDKYLPPIGLSLWVGCFDDFNRAAVRRLHFTDSGGVLDTAG